MSDQDFIKLLWDSGHFWNPSSVNAPAVKHSDLQTLTMDDQEVKEAVMSYQNSDANLYPIAQAFHGRTLIADGEAGPATRFMADMPRCPIPDHPPPPNATFFYENPDLQKAVESMQAAAATGSGSWPAGCGGDPSVHEVTISYDLSNLTAKHKEWWPDIKARSHAAVAAVGIKLVEVPVGQRANINVYGKVLGGSVIGLAQFNSQSCGDNVFCQLNPNYAPEKDMVLNLLLHENGHNWNLEHVAGNIMNPSILRTPTYWVQRVGGNLTYQDNSYPTLKRFFGGMPIAGSDPVDPPPIGPDGTNVLVTLDIDNSGPVPKASIVSVSRRKLLV